MGQLDTLVVGLFFFVIFLIGVIDRKRVSIDDYWVNSRRTHRVVLVATVVFSFLGVGSFLGNAGITYSGAGFATFILVSSFFFYFLIFAKFFAPKIKEFGDQYNAYTLPDFLEHRYSKRVRVADLLVNVVIYGLWLSLQILGFGIFVSSIGGFNPYFATLLGGFIVILYTTVGGLRADIRTDVFQFMAMFLLLFVFFL